jgi:hypothetical protein
VTNKFQFNKTVRPQTAPVHLEALSPVDRIQNGAAVVMPRTQAVYQKATQALFDYSKAKRETDPEEPFLPSFLEMVEDLYERTDLKLATKRIYRAALLWSIIRSERHSPDEIAAMEILDGNRLRSNGERKKQKPVVAREQYLRLIHSLQSMADGGNHQWAEPVLVWVRSGLATGLRPVEWLGAELVDASRVPDVAHSAGPAPVAYLRVRSAKQKLLKPAFQRMGKAASRNDFINLPQHWEKVNSAHRFIPIASAEEVAAVEQHLAYIQTYLDGKRFEIYRRECLTKANPQMPSDETVFQKYFDSARMFLRKTNADLFKGKQRITLYTLRRQFSANAKAAVGSEVTSVLMGHSRPDSPSASYYGKANQAFKGETEKTVDKDRDVEASKQDADAPAR